MSLKITGGWSSKCFHYFLNFETFTSEPYCNWPGPEPSRFNDADTHPIWNPSSRLVPEFDPRWPFQLEEIIPLNMCQLHGLIKQKETHFGPQLLTDAYHRMQ